MNVFLNISQCPAKAALPRVLETRPSANADQHHDQMQEHVLELDPEPVELQGAGLGVEYAWEDYAVFRDSIASRKPKPTDREVYDLVREMWEVRVPDFERWQANLEKARELLGINTVSLLNK